MAPQWWTENVVIRRSGADGRAGDDAERSDEVGVPPSRAAARGRAAAMTAPATMQNVVMRRSGGDDRAGDDAERSDEEERRR
jgi:hypothetical protein